MKKLFLLLGVLIIADICWLALTNNNHTLAFYLKPFFPQITINSGGLYAILGIYGALGGFLVAMYKNEDSKGKIKKLTRSIEKSSVSTEKSSDKIKALESKIKTLEIALKEALKKTVS